MGGEQRRQVSGRTFHQLDLGTQDKLTKPFAMDPSRDDIHAVVGRAQSVSVVC